MVKNSVYFKEVSALDHVPHGAFESKKDISLVPYTSYMYTTALSDFDRKLLKKNRLGKVPSEPATALKAERTL